MTPLEKHALIAFVTEDPFYAHARDRYISIIQQDLDIEVIDMLKLDYERQHRKRTTKHNGGMT